MKEHIAKMIISKLESDGAVAVLMRCCDDPATDAWHTLYVKPETSNQDVLAFLKAVQGRTEQQHAAILNARDIMERGFV